MEAARLGDTTQLRMGLQCIWGMSEPKGGIRITHHFNMTPMFESNMVPQLLLPLESSSTGRTALQGPSMTDPLVTV